MNLSAFDLDQLMYSDEFNGPLFVEKHERSKLIAMLRCMLIIREVEFTLAKGKKEGFIVGPVHLGIGQEAVAIGVSNNLYTSDNVFGAHRSHSHLLAMGADIEKLFCEVLARKTGLAKGMGGSMHLWDGAVGFRGSVPIVAGTVSIALGAAMASRLKQTDNVAVAYFGDGACEEGVVHESLNLASINKEPIIFVVENNLFASHMHISKRQPVASTARFAAANGIKHQIVDGNDVLSVADAAKGLIEAARCGEGPGFLEAVTYRWLGHVDWREDVDVGVERSKSDIQRWKSRDPIKRLKQGLIDASWWSSKEQTRLELEVSSIVKSAWQAALDAPHPDPDDLVKWVYAQ